MPEKHQPLLTPPENIHRPLSPPSLGGLFVGLFILATPVCSTGAESQPQGKSAQQLYSEAIGHITEGRAEEATQALSQILTDTPLHAGAWLDLAILHCTTGQHDKAEALFKSIEERFSPPPGIREVINLHRQQGCKKKPLPDFLSLSIGRGSDSNANQGAAHALFSIGSGDTRLDLQLRPELLPRSDQFTALSAEYATELTDRMTGFAQIRLRENDQLANYSTKLLRSGISYRTKAGAWQLQTTGSLSWLTLGGDLYQKKEQLQALLSPDPAPTQGLSFGIISGITHTQYVTLKSYNSVTLEGSGYLAFHQGKHRIQLSTGLMHDLGSSARPGGNRKGTSTSLAWQLPLIDETRLELGWARQQWQGDDAYLPGLIDERRQQSTQLLHATVSIPLNHRQAINFEYRNLSNQENISLFSYRSQQIQLNWLWQVF